MPTTLKDLVLRVRTQIRDNGTSQAFPDEVGTDSKPIAGSSPELIQFIQDGLMEYSRWRPRRRPYTLQILQGQTTYQMPEDWITVDDLTFNKAKLPTPLPDPDVYALPFVYVYQPLGVQLNTMEFHWYDDDQQLILGSAPMAPYTLTFDYYAFHTADTTETTVPKQEQYYAMLPACQKALMALATDYGVKLQKYKIGGRYGAEVDDSKIAETLQKQADDYADQFRKHVIMRPYGTSGGGED